MAHPRNIDAHNLYRLDQAELPDPQQQEESFDEVLDQLARHTAYQRN